MKIKTTTITLLIMLTGSFQAFAGETLTPDQIKALIVGNTVHAKHLKKGFNFSVYFAEDGSVIRKWKKGRLQDGTFFFKNGLHCINVGKGDKCASLVDNSDGTYKRLKKGKANKHFITWVRIVEGKDL